MRPFEGVKVLDCTHVLAGPFTAYQLAVLGADVIKVEDPNEPDQSRESGGDHELNKALMGTGFMTQGSNKRSIALNLKTEGGREALKRLVRDWADVLIENYRPGAFKALGLGYDELSTAQADAGLRVDDRVRTGRAARQPDRLRPRDPGDFRHHRVDRAPSSGPIKTGAPVIDYATGTMGAFAISAALYQTMRTGKGQHIDMAMIDVALILQARTSPTTSTPASTPSARATNALSRSRRCTRRGRVDPARAPPTAGSTAASTTRSASRPRRSARASRSATRATKRSTR